MDHSSSMATTQYVVLSFKIQISLLTTTGIDRRGVVVTVYTFSPNSTPPELYNYEMGNLGKYFN
jgi:hypothetical protein